MYLQWITKKPKTNPTNQWVTNASELLNFQKSEFLFCRMELFIKLNWGEMWKWCLKRYLKRPAKNDGNLNILWPQEVLQSYFSLFLTAALGEQHSSSACSGLEKDSALKWVISLWKYGRSEGYCIDSLLIVGGERKGTSEMILENSEL